MQLSRPFLQFWRRHFIKVSWLISWFKLLNIQWMIRANHSELPFHVFFVQIVQRCTLLCFTIISMRNMKMSFCDPSSITMEKASNIANGAGLNVCLINARGA